MLSVGSKKKIRKLLNFDIFFFGVATFRKNLTVNIWKYVQSMKSLKKIAESI